MKIFLTGGTGFIGGHVARKLRQRDDEVVALVRSPSKATALRELGCELVAGDLGDVEAISDGIDGCEAVIHGAAIYEVGVKPERHQAMFDANVTGTENVLRAALEAKVPRVVYVSTIAVFGNTNGEVVDETYEHPGTSFCSYYEETKWRAHRLAKDLIAEGLPCVLIQPGGVYGPNDHSELGDMIKMFAKGRLPLLPFGDLGINLVHVEDVADGVLLGLDKGEVGESYLLGSRVTTMREAIETVAEMLGKRPPREMPTILIKAAAPFGSVIGPPLGFPPNLTEAISASDGVTFWARHDKAVEELGYQPRSLETGLRQTLEAEGLLSG